LRLLSLKPNVRLSFVRVNLLILVGIRMSTYTITTFCTVLWYLCVLSTLVWAGKTYALFGNHSAHGWLLILAAFAASLAVNFLFNPLIWIIAGANIKAAKQESVESKWQFYPPMIGILILACTIAAVILHVKMPPGLRARTATAYDAQTHTTALPEDSVEIDGIMFSGKPSALVNGQVLEVGDEISGLVVVAIREHSVVFTNKDGKEIIKVVK
jgi:hypothetical protein